jgi:transcriptional regulator with XRE-family HTH domain
MTQRQVADLVGRETNYLSKIERAERQPSGPLRTKLAAALGLSLEAIYGMPEPAPGRPDEERDPYPNRRALRASSHWREAEPEAQAYIAGISNLRGDYSLDEWLEELRVANRKVRRGERLDLTTDALGRVVGEEDVVDDPDD